MQTVRTSAVAGLFYPADAAELQAQVEHFLECVEPSTEPPPKAIIAPHAGYVYSGPVAASAYARLRAAHDIIQRVVLLGPSHRLGFRGIAVSNMAAFATPLGPIPVDQEAIEQIRYLPEVGCLEQAHAREHSLEVHLPFLQAVLGQAGSGGGWRCPSLRGRGGIGSVVGRPRNPDRHQFRPQPLSRLPDRPLDGRRNLASHRDAAVRGYRLRAGLRT